MTSSDTKFFTNTVTDSLYNRFLHTIKDSQYFDILVGYFRTSGFYKLYSELETVEKIRILVGLNVDKKTVDLLDQSKQNCFDFEAHSKCRVNYSDTLEKEIELSEDSLELEVAAKKFIEFIQKNKLEIRVHPSQNIHAKIYISRFYENDRDLGRVVTGSSNFSENGLSAQREFNVELKDPSDVKYALERFEELWLEGVDVGQEYTDTIQNKTWLSDNVTPYDIYLKFLYEHFKEDINIDENIDVELPNGFMELDYQKQAIISAKRILDEYQGVFLSDVVGLGKTFIAALLLQKLERGKILVICPPVISDHWKDTLDSFHIPATIESLGMLEKIIKKGTEDYKYVIVDEAHRFRNETTTSYENLHRICKGKKIILLSATPLNNKFADLKAQIGLFQSLKRSNIPNITDLDHFFKVLQKDIDRHQKGSPDYLRLVKENSAKIRDKVLSHIMVRRTRTEIKNFFKDDIEKQGLSFPEIADPQRIIYQFDEITDAIFTETIQLLKVFTYSRYMPLLFLRSPLSEFDAQSQRNVGGFMKGILVKRLESSFYAFKKSLSRFIQSYEKFIKMYNGGTIYISNKVDVFDLLENDNQEALHDLLEEDKATKYTKDEFSNDFIEKLNFDLEILYKVQKLWADIKSDPKLDAFITELKNNKILKNQKIIIFSESKETTQYLQENLDRAFPDKVLSFSSQGGVFQKQKHSNRDLRDTILENYQPKHKNAKNDVRILITTDILAEGINLHRSHIIINYDLPWNPTRILQRVGRVNRIGTTHSKIYVFNIFPTAQSDAELGLEKNITSKLQAFHTILGEDAKYLTDDEEVSTHNLFGETLYEKMNRKAMYEEANDDISNSELYYLQAIRDIRDHNQSLFHKIKYLPKKSRACRLSNNQNYCNGVLTFFRKGRLKKFVFNSAELNFIEAARLFECDSDTKAQKIPSDYFDHLSNNKGFLEKITNQDAIDMEIPHKRGKDNGKKIINIIKAYLKSTTSFTDDDEAFLKNVRKGIENGDLSKNTLKKVAQEADKILNNPVRFLQTVRHHIKPDMLYTQTIQKTHTHHTEVILSEFLLSDKE